MANGWALGSIVFASTCTRRRFLFSLENGRRRRVACSLALEEQWESAEVMNALSCAVP